MARAPIAVPTRAAIDDAIAQLGYRPNPIARSLVTRSTQTIALLLPDITNPFYAELVSGIQQLMLDGDQSMLLCTTNGDPEQEARYLRLLRAKHVDGVLVDGLGLAPERIAAFVGTASRSSASTATSTSRRSRSCRSTTGSARASRPTTCSRSATPGSPTSLVPTRRSAPSASPATARR